MASVLFDRGSDHCGCTCPAALDLAVALLRQSALVQKERTTKLLRPIVGYWIVPLASTGAGYFYGLGFTGGPRVQAADLLFLLPWFGLMLITAIIHVGAYDLPYRSLQAYAPTDTEDLREAKTLNQRFQRKWDLSLDLFVSSLLVALGGLALVFRTGAWQWKVMVVIGYALPLLIYQSKLAGLSRNARSDALKMRDTSPAYQSLKHARYRLVTPTLLAAYVPFLIGAAIALPRGLLTFVLAILLGIWIIYGSFVWFIRSSRAFFIACVLLFIFGVLLWSTGKFVPGWGLLKSATSLHLFALTYGLYMGAFEFLGVTRYELWEEQHRKAYGFPEGKSVQEQKETNDRNLAYSHLSLIFFFVVFPLTYLADSLGVQYVVAAGLFGVGAWLWWLIYFPSSASVEEDSGRLAQMKSLAYILPMIVVLGRPAILTPAKEIALVIVLPVALGLLGFLTAFVLSVKRELKPYSITDATTLLALRSFAALMVALGTPLAVVLFSDNEGTIGKATQISLVLSLSSIITMIVTVREYLRRQQPSEA